MHDPGRAKDRERTKAVARGLRGRIERGTRLFLPTRRIRFDLAVTAVERFAAGRSIRIADAGCSEALLSERIALRHPDWSIDAIDVDPQALTIARTALRAAGIRNVRLLEGDLTELIDRDGYDAVLALECLTLVSDDATAAASMARALKPGGLFVAHVPEKSWEPVVSELSIWPGELRHGYDSEEIVSLLERAGLHGVSIVHTSRRVARLGRELSDRVARSGLVARAIWYPFSVAAASLDRHGVTWGPSTGLFVTAHR